MLDDILLVSNKNMNPLNYTLLIKRLPSWLYKFGAKLYIDYTFPRHIFIETTTRCNLKCPMCPRPDINEDMEWGIFIKIIDEAKQYGSRSFSLHLFGEPLLDITLVDKIKYIKSANKKNSIILTTNGTIHNREVYDLVDKIIITYKLPLNLITREEWRYKIMLRLFDDYHIPKGWQVERKDYHNYGGNVQVADIANSRRYPCYHLWLAPAIAYNGDILICCNSPYHDKSSLLGNIKNTTLAEVWKGLYLTLLRNNHKCGVYGGICSQCNVYKTYPSLF